jgi:hypothetical protein
MFLGYNYRIMVKCLVIICLFAVSVAGKPQDAGNNKNCISGDKPPASTTTYSYNANCCTKQASQQADKQPSRWYTPFERPDWWLVVIAAFTGGVIGWQSWETRKSANAALKSAKAQMDADRAWVTSNAIGNPIQPLNTPRYTPGVVYLIEVTGNSPVIIIRERFRCRIVPVVDGTNPVEPLLEEIPTFKSEEGMFPDTVRPAGNKYNIPVNLESGPITQSQWSDLQDGKTVLCAYGCIEYEDAFRRPHHTRVCSIYHSGDGGVFESPDGTRLNPPSFRIGGPKTYNEYT